MVHTEEEERCFIIIVAGADGWNDLTEGKGAIIVVEGIFIEWGCMVVMIARRE